MKVRPLELGEVASVDSDLLSFATMGLPTLDLSRFIRGDDMDRKSFGSELLDSLSQHGFVKLVNHGIEDEEVCELFGWVSVPAEHLY